MHMVKLKKMYSTKIHGHIHTNNSIHKVFTFCLHASRLDCTCTIPYHMHRLCSLHLRLITYSIEGKKCNMFQGKSRREFTYVSKYAVGGGGGGGGGFAESSSPLIFGNLYYCIDTLTVNCCLQVSLPADNKIHHSVHIL